jgi:hypothetical protein
MVPELLPGRCTCDHPRWFHCRGRKPDGDCAACDCRAYTDRESAPPPQASDETQLPHKL